jgi:hypothetical protein
MILEQFGEQVRPMVKNENAIAVNTLCVYLFTNDSELLAFDATIYVAG